MKEKIWLSSPHMGGHEMKYIDEGFARNLVFPMGPNVTGLEEDLKKFSGTKACACLSSGTAALHLALINLGVDMGDEVICSSFTFSASANPIAYQKAIPVFVDSEISTWNINRAILETAIKDRIAKGKKPKAIIAVHLYGVPARIDEIMKIANKYEIPVIEDAAEALGSKYFGKPLGSIGVIGILSFNGNKIITTSGGGALISDNKDYIVKARFLSTQARDNAPHYQHSEIGHNYRISNVCAGIGRGQMRVLEKRVRQRRDNFNFYEKEIGGFEGIDFQLEPEGAFSNRWLTTIIIDPGKTGGITREDLRLAMAKENIECRPLWKPMHLQPVFGKYPFYGDHTSENLFENGLCLPSGSNLSAEDRSRILNCFKSVFNNE